MHTINLCISYPYPCSLQAVTSEKKIEDKEILELLAQPIKKQKKKKEKKAAA